MRTRARLLRRPSGVDNRKIIRSRARPTTPASPGPQHGQNTSSRNNAGAVPADAPGDLQLGGSPTHRHRFGKFSKADLPADDQGWRACSDPWTTPARRRLPAPESSARERVSLLFRPGADTASSLSAVDPPFWGAGRCSVRHVRRTLTVRTDAGAPGGGLLGLPGSMAGGMARATTAGTATAVRILAIPEPERLRRRRSNRDPARRASSPTVRRALTTPRAPQARPAAGPQHHSPVDAGRSVAASVATEAPR
jgi:hypothetical protein